MTEDNLPQLLAALDADDAMLASLPQDSPLHPSNSGRRSKGAAAQRDQYVCLCGHLLATHTPDLCPTNLRASYPWDFDTSFRSGGEIPRVVSWNVHLGKTGCFGSLKHYGADYKIDERDCQCQTFQPVLKVRRLGQYFRNRNTYESPALLRGYKSALRAVSDNPARRYELEWLVPLRCHRCSSTNTVLPYWVRDEAMQRVDFGCLDCRAAAFRRPV